jgi:GMP synthase (glutamine-hydrolysing)
MASMCRCNMYGRLSLDFLMTADMLCSRPLCLIVGSGVYCKRLTRGAAMKPFLILQLRREDEASDDEYAAFLRAGNLKPEHTHRVRIEREDVPLGNLDQYSGVIVGGGAPCVSDIDKPPDQIRFEYQLDILCKEILEKDFPYLGACYGLGFLCKSAGGEVSKAKYGEILGAVTVTLSEEGKRDPLFQGVVSPFRAFVGHKEACQAVPPGAVLIGSARQCPVQAIRIKQNIYGTQFHPELDGDGLAVRVRVYRHAGYFPPEQADELIARAAQERVTEPEKVFRNFIERYRR